jgi:hypothetical protein
LRTIAVRGPALAIMCEAYGRHGRYDVEKLMAEHGDAKLTDSLATLADCPKARSASVCDRCKAVYEGLDLRRRLVSMPTAMPHRPQAMNQCRLPLRKQ